MALIYEVIPLIDRFMEVFKNIIMDTRAHPSLQHMAKIALELLNKYYLFTDDCEVYQVSICMFVSSLIAPG